MSQTILEKDSVSVNMLVTSDMFPLPEDAYITKHLGEETIYLTDHDKKANSIVHGQHMIIVFEAQEFVEWIGDKPFWLFNSDNNEFQYIKLKRED